MRQCPKCNRQFEDALMSFCPDDGMILVDPSLAGIKTSADPSSGPSSQDSTLVLPPPGQPGSWAMPNIELPAPEPWRPVVQTPPAQPQPWRPPPPPAYVKPP